MNYALITGASSGIGEQFARQLAAQGRSLILVARSERKLEVLSEELKQKYGVNVPYIIQDLAKLESAEELYKIVKAKGYHIDLLINNAGIGLIGEFAKQPLDKLNEMIILNVVTPTKLIRLFQHDLEKKQGTVLNVASQAAFEPLTYMASYGGTKAYLLNLTEALREEFKDKGIKFIALCPGPTKTNFFRRAGYDANIIQFKKRDPKEVVEEALEGIKKNQAVIMPGFENKVMTFLNRFMPIPLLAKMSQLLVKREKL